MIEIEESGILFGPFAEDLVYENDKSKVLPRYVKAVEFTLLNNAGNRLVFVEAKSSWSNPANKEDFEHNADAVVEKMVDSLSTLAAAHLGKQPDIKNELPGKIRSFKWQKCDIYLRLVIPTFKDSWLPPISDALRTKLKHFLASFGIPANHFQVVNERMARQQKLIRT